MEKLAVYFQEDRAFVRLDPKWMLCIGSREEVEKANEHKLVRMIREAIAINAYDSIESSKGVTVQ